MTPVAWYDDSATYIGIAFLFMVIFIILGLIAGVTIWIHCLYYKLIGEVDPWFVLDPCGICGGKLYPGHIFSHWVNKEGKSISICPDCNRELYRGIPYE